MVEVKRRTFLAGVGLLAARAAADGGKLVDGGLADVSWAVEPARENPLVPPGAVTLGQYALACVGCQLCVKNCPNRVLKPFGARSPSGALNPLQPSMQFTHGYCRPECTVCGDVCPAGAIRAFTPQEKKTIHIGHAVWKADRCVAAKDGVACHVCERHCPVKAITLVPQEGAPAHAPKVPRLDKRACIGCGACEHLCPSRPLPAIFVSGTFRHRRSAPTEA